MGFSVGKLQRKGLYWYRAFTSCDPQPKCDTKVDIIIPVISKDLAIIPLCLSGLRANIPHIISEIYIVANSTDGIVQEFCRKNKLQFIEEREILGYGPTEIDLKIGHDLKDRSGWLFQQLLKLSGRIGTSEHYITIDADHVLLRPHTFITADGNSVFYQSYEHHLPYYDNIRRLIGFDPIGRLSYVSHKMVFKRDNVSNLHRLIETSNPGKSWDQAIIDSVDRNEISGFSEFELYGNFVPENQKICLPTLNHHLSPASATSLDAIKSRYGHFFRSVTFPDYKS